MRKFGLMAALLATGVSPLAQAQTVNVQSHSLLRLPANSSSLQLEALQVEDYGTLLIPANLVDLKVADLRLGHEARIAIVPGERALHMQVAHAQLGSGSEILARGAPGTYEKAALPGRDLELRLGTLQAEALSVDARGGAGAPGYAGLDGANGQPAGCTWGAAGRGANGDNGGDGHPGAAGAQVRLQVPLDFPVEQIRVRVEGGAGGLAGKAGEPGAGGKSKGCVVYRADGGKAGRPGLAGQAGAPGPAGAVSIDRR